MDNVPAVVFTLKRLDREWFHPPIDDWVYITISAIESMERDLHYMETSAAVPYVVKVYKRLYDVLRPRIRTEGFAPREWTSQPYDALADAVATYRDTHWGTLRPEEREYFFIAEAFNRAKGAVANRDLEKTTELANFARKWLARFIRRGGREEIRRTQQPPWVTVTDRAGLV